MSSKDKKRKQKGTQVKGNYLSSSSSSTTTSYERDNYCSNYHPSYSGFHQAMNQTQTQRQLQRSVEASKQMLYGTFGNVIAILEEFEQREIWRNSMQTPKNFKKSKIEIPDQRHKQFADVKSIVETQILLFETQSTVCPSEVREALLEDLKKKTLEWTAVRAEIGLPENQETDRYVSKLYEILATGKTNHKVPSSQGLTENVMRESVQHILHGDHDRQMLDQSFKKNPNKKAEAPDTRQSDMLDEAARRISNANGRSNLEDDVYRIKESSIR